MKHLLNGRVFLLLIILSTWNIYAQKVVTTAVKSEVAGSISVNGTVKLWQNGVLKADIHYDTTAMGEPPSAWPEFGLYQDAGNPPGNWAVFDRFVAANTFEQANS